MKLNFIRLNKRKQGKLDATSMLHAINNHSAEILRRLESFFPIPSDSRHPGDETYNPALRPLYVHFVAALYGICSPYTSDPHELAYIAAAQWPAFVRPVLDEHQRRIDEYQLAKMEEEQDGESHIEDEVEFELQPPSEDVRIRLIRVFTPSITAALNTLYPRLSFANAWATANVPPANLLAIPPKSLPPLPIHEPKDQDSYAMLKSLPRMAKFILVASFIASNNPAKTDMRMFGRGPDERKKRRKGGSPRKMSAKNAAVKVRRFICFTMAIDVLVDRYRNVYWDR